MRQPSATAHPLDGPAAMAAARGTMATRQDRTEQEGSRLDEVHPAPIGPVAWGPIPGVAAPWQQIGTHGAAIQSQVPAKWSGLQRGCVSGTLYPGWQLSPSSQYPNWQRTQLPAHSSGAQRKSQQSPGQGPGSATRAPSAYRITAAAAAAQAQGLQAQLSAWGSR